jgi:hypothetical protein
MWGRGLVVGAPAIVSSIQCLVAMAKSITLKKTVGN